MAKSSKVNPSTLNRRTALTQLRRASERYSSKAEFARKTGLSSSTVYRWTKQGNKSLPSHESIERAAKALNRIHYQPPKQPPRVKAYSRDELAKIAIWSSAAGKESIRSKTLSDAKIERATRAILEGKPTPTIRITDRIETIRARFIEYSKTRNAEEIQLAGESFYSSFDISERGTKAFARAWYDEMKTLCDTAIPGIAFFDFDKFSKSEVKSLRRQGMWHTDNPMSFHQVFSYFLDLPGGYFGATVDLDSGEIIIFEINRE